MKITDYKKMFIQLKNKPAKLAKYTKHNKPRVRKHGNKPCERCGRVGAHIGSYGLHYCRQCFREIATKVGFKKYH